MMVVMMTINITGTEVWVKENAIIPNVTIMSVIIVLRRRSVILLISSVLMMNMMV